jgi:diguanylate cyclase (GGDEF)-like protein/PAS domain S-box-containing protein
MKVMHAILNTFALALFVSSLLTLIASAIAWKRSVPGSFALSLLLLAMTLWSSTYALYFLPISSTIKIHLPYVTYISVVTVPSLFLVFTLAFTNQEHWLTSRIIGLLLAEPILTLFLVWTNQYHDLVFQASAQTGIPLIEMPHGPWYLINMVYSYLIILVGLAILVYGMARSSPLLKNQYLTVLIASLFPWVTSIIIEYFGQTSQYDFTSVMFGLSGIIFTYSVLSNRFIDIIPVARSRLIESMSDGILVLDTQNRIVDINPAMEKLFDHKPGLLMGTRVSEVLKAWMDQSDSVLRDEKTRIELRLPNSPSRYLDLRVTPLYSSRGLLSGRLMVFRDVTDRKQVEKKLRQANERLQLQLIEIGTLQSKLRSQAIRDPLTNLFNRRYLDETLDRELARAARENYPVCVIMMDLDHFKKVNDTYGHEAGDLVLKALAETLSACSRRGDFACRYGGEEFVVVMPNIAVEVACQRAETLRKTLSAMQIPYGKFLLSTTISMGIACYPFNGEEREAVLRAADRAMYAAKNAGRNHILTYDKLEAQHNSPNN